MSDPDTGRLDERLRAVERAITDDDRSPADLAGAAEATDRIEDLERRVEAIEDELADLEAAVRALRGYVGNVRSVNREVEQRADTAVSVARSVQSRLDATTDEDHAAGETDDDWPSPWNAAGGSGDGAADGTDGSSGDRTDATAREREDRDPRRQGDSREAEPTNGPDRRGSADADPAVGSGRDPGTETAVGPGEEGDPGGGEGRITWDETAWPGGDAADGAEPRSDGGHWPGNGMDVDRAQPWSVPDRDRPRNRHGGDDDEKGLLERVRETL